jgi:fumarate reductase flavoprotein subunit
VRIDHVHWTIFEAHYFEVSNKFFRGEMMSSKISRRDFMKGTAVTAAGLGILGTAGCAPKSTTSSDQPQNGTPPENGIKKFAIAPVKLSDAGKPSYTCDYLVIGAGNCGMMSAAYAASLGLSVIVLEKNTITGGSSVGTEVTMAYSDCKIIQECGKDPNVINVSQQTGTPAQIYTYFMMHNSWEANAQLVTNFIQNNHNFHDFLYANGGYPQMLLPSLDAPTDGIMYKGEGKGAFKVMQDAAEKNKVQILLKTPATALVINDSGAVVGAMADQDGKKVYVSAKAVFVGTGGFSTNADMVAYYIPGYGQIAHKADAPLKHDGDGIRMMFGVGGVESDMHFVQCAGSTVKGANWESSVDTAGREPYLWVNHLGERLGNEKWTVMDTTFKVGIKEKSYTYFNIIDSSAVTRMQESDLMTSARTVLGSSKAIPTMSQDLEKGVQDGLVFKGETIGDLAKAAGIDPDGLAETIKNYNAMCAAGNDTQFYKDPKTLFALEKGPFYAFEMIPSWYSTLCGVKINGNIEVIDGEGRAIPGLYAGGLDSGDFFKDNYNHGFSGSCSGYSYFSGYHAADMAKAYIAAL